MDIERARADPQARVSAHPRARGHGLLASAHRILSYSLSPSRKSELSTYTVCEPVFHPVHISTCLHESVQESLTYKKLTRCVLGNVLASELIYIYIFIYNQ